MSLSIFGPRPYFWQWDTGRQLVVQNDECGEVHFCNGTDDCSLVVEIKTTDDGIRVVDVPNLLLQSAKAINAYLYQKIENGEQTIQLHRFQVMARTRPADYVYTETEVKTWERLEADIRSAIDLVGYYTPVVDHENDMIYWEASRTGMPDVEPVEIPKGEPGYTPQKGIDYTDGDDGITPHIGENGNWYLGETDTGKPSRGEPGYTPQKGIDYTDGTSVTVSSVSESTADGGSNVVTFSDGKTLTVKNGQTGTPGKTPEKGTDYYTDADKTEMVNSVLAALPTWNGGSY